MSAVIRDEIEAAAIALTRHRGLRWERIPEPWRQEARRQARTVLAAARQAREGGYRVDPETAEPDLLDRINVVPVQPREGSPR